MTARASTARHLLALVVALALLAGACGGDDEGRVPATGVPQRTTAPAEKTLEPVADWDPILATTQALTPAPQAVCATETNPDTPGQREQPRPGAAWVGSRAAAFDRVAGKIVYVEREAQAFGPAADEPAQTWTFDVCTNAWRPAGVLPVPGGGFGEGPMLVYDVDSDATLAISDGGNVSVYDTAAGTWTQQPSEPFLEAAPGLTRGAVYDPVSGLVLTTDNRGGWDVDERYELWAYDVETNTWTLVGPIPQEAYDFGLGAEEIDLLGHSESIDRLILTTGTFAASATVLVDPRSGRITRVDVETPLVFFRSPVGAFGTAADTVFATMASRESAVCGFSTDARTWTNCFEVPESGPPQPYPLFAAMVGDTINERLVLINRVFEVGATLGVDDIWAVDPATGTWTELLAPSAFTPLLPDPSGAAATGSTSFPDLDDAVAGDDGAERLPLGQVTAPAFADRLDFLHERCDDDFCYRDAVFVNPEDPSLVSAAWEADKPFHVRHGFVNESEESLGADFDVVLYAYEYDGVRPDGPVRRYSSDYVLRGSTDQCGPTYRGQSAPVTCEWFVHEFPDGLPSGRHALWAIWEAPCSAWSAYGFVDSCDDPDEIRALFASGVDSPWGPGPVEWDPR